MKKNNENKRKQAVALQYEADRQQAPKVIAKGKGLIADNILERARQNNIPVQEDPALVELLGSLDINESIPEELYQAVAEVFAFLYRVDKEAGRS
ncbi:EscU/YscU/HrcU family type III secretion system export apparatus switch protein [Rossellomorea vietnamensis]|uniref:EscU/YscU/HrcU family type III secretion system export apparatus switch protein n=1 Tax=Rossellomorea vietnamensis TaxID=218284 RepID=A0A5D4NU85_9BACI|nr:EscU/YscU/HrcU family type III secretion system export apparatus switch protein [Rossellomorea vietnamensis]TYS16302.1 EscU/YscU/HrcU family type III secretion system export apparatus switch protein [Rossellomorea vietnamensis]